MWSLGSAVFLALALTGNALAGSIVCDGVLGNSGEAGPTLVRFAEKGNGRNQTGLGVAVDRFGSLWDRGGAGQLNRYAPDGRLLATYPISTGSGRTDRLMLVGDTLVLLIDGKLFTLNVAAPAGTKPTAVPVAVKEISYGAVNGRLAAVDAAQQLILLEPITGKTEALLTLPFESVTDLEMTGTGEVYFYADQKLQKVSAGKLVTNATWPRKTWGERENRAENIQWLDGVWFGQAGHGTIKRYAPDWEPDPGVVLGGGSGWVIAALPANEEIGSGRGLAKLRDNLFAVSGGAGVLHLLEWKPAEHRLEIVRRIGAIHNLPGLALDSEGRVFTGDGQWRWTDGPATPYRTTMNNGFTCQVATLDTGAIATLGVRYGSVPVWCSGFLKGNLFQEQLPDKNHWVGAAAMQRRVILIAANGAAHAMAVGSDGKRQQDLGDVTLPTTTPLKIWTTLARKDDQTLLAAADGSVVEFGATETGWREDRRWHAWGTGAAESFGTTISITADTGRLWVTDREQSRVLCFELATGKLLAKFGGSAGNDLAHLSQPTTLAVVGDRALVFDSGNQRLVKLRFQP